MCFSLRPPAPNAVLPSPDWWLPVEAVVSNLLSIHPHYLSTICGQFHTWFFHRFHYECQPDRYDPDHDLLVTIRFKTSPKLADDDYLFTSIKKMIARVILYAEESKELPYLHLFDNGNYFLYLLIALFIELLHFLSFRIRSRPTPSAHSLSNTWGKWFRDCNCRQRASPRTRLFWPATHRLYPVLDSMLWQKRFWPRCLPWTV